MKLKHLFIILAVVDFIHGFGFVLAPRFLTSVYGVSLADADAVYMTRLYGAGLLVYAFVAWFARNAPDSEARRAIVLGFCITGVIGFIVAAVGKLTGVMNALSWLVMGLYLVLVGIGFGYFYFVRPDSA